MTIKYQIYKRKGKFYRTNAIRGEQYDGSKWVLVKSYKKEEDMKKALLIHEDRNTRSDGSKKIQYKSVVKEV